LERWVKKTLVATIVALAMLIPLASTFPDGLERVVETLGVKAETGVWHAPMPDYTIDVITNSYVSTFTAGLTGFLIVLVVTWLIGKAAWVRKAKRGT